MFPGTGVSKYALTIMASFIYTYSITLSAHCKFYIRDLVENIE